MTTILGFWKRCNWCGKISFLGLGWISGDYCSGMCADHKRIGYDVDSGDKAKGGFFK